MSDYTVEILSANISVGKFIADYRDAERIEGYCRSCPNYGRNWSCPPFHYDVEELLRRYQFLLFVVLKVSPCNIDISSNDFEQYLLSERRRLEERLRCLEDVYSGLSCDAGCCCRCHNDAYNGRTDEGEWQFVAANACNRLVSKPCRFPHCMRPSLEAYGFDLDKAVRSLFCLPLLWTDAVGVHSLDASSISSLKSSVAVVNSAYRVCIGGLLHNNEVIKW
ncbi:MAG: DUF2284 domain-containing protein [Bacteroidaceae bacterium]|nr:DUF2284 domain-containing protein [Bacteroidaceae bacterium]